MTLPNKLFENLSVLQQQYWETVMGAAPKPTGDNTDNPFAQPLAWMEQWQTMMQSLLPEPLSSLKSSFPPVFTIGKLYADLADGFSGQSNTVPDYEWWISSMESYYQDWQKQLESTPFASFNPADFANAAAADTPIDMPAAMQQWVELQQQCQTHYLTLVQQNMETLQSLRIHLQEQPQALTSFAELNELWQALYQQTQENMLQAGSALPNLMENFSAWQTANTSARSDESSQHDATNKADEMALEAEKAQQQWAKKLTALTKKHATLSQENQTLQGEVSQLKTHVGVLEKQLAALKTSPAAEKKTDTKVAQTTKTVTAARKTANKNKPSDGKASVSDSKKTDSKAAATGSDDLTQIKGLGPKMQERLIDAGIQTFEQLAALSPEAAGKLDESLNAQGRLLREDWVGQAAQLKRNNPGQLV